MQNNNAAYDFARFEPRRVEQPTHRTQEQNIRLVQPVKRTRRQAKQEATQTAYKTVKVFLLTAAFVSVLAAQIYSTVKLDELDHQLSTIQTDMAVAVSENTRLNMELDSRLSLSKIEDYVVNNLGMVKQENYKVEYVELSDGDCVVLSQAKEKKGEGLKEKFQKLRSYIF